MTDVVEQIESLIDDYDVGALNSLRFSSVWAWLNMSKEGFATYNETGEIPEGWEPPEWTK